jgi:hypothetical protein
MTTENTIFIPDTPNPEDKAKAKGSKPLVKSKDIYTKFLLLTDKDSGRPPYERTLRGSSKPIAIYDVVHYQVHCIFNKKVSDYEWKFGSSVGQIDNVVQLYPFYGLTTDAYPVSTPGTWLHRLTSNTSEALFVVPHYNSFQRNHENVFGIVEELIGELRLTVDFSSINTKPGQEDSLFTKLPKAFIVKAQDPEGEPEYIREIPTDYVSKSQRVFSAFVSNIDNDRSLKFEWEINWKSLALKTLSDDIPDNFVREYYKASKHIEFDPEASALYSRKCLQRLLEEKGGVKSTDNLSKQIDEAMKTLPTPLANAIDYIRNIGNFAAHPTKSLRTGEPAEVEPGEAEWCLQVLENLFDYYFVMPAELERRRASVDKKLLDAGRKPMKQKTT